MASLYRCEVKWPVRRGKGQSIVAKAAYNSRSKLYNDRDEKWTRDYGRPDKTSRGHEDVLFSGIFVDPKLNAPEWVKDRSRLWNEASNAQGTRKNARDGGQELILNLPNDLSLEAQKRMTIDFVRENLTRNKGRVADVNIHDAPKTGDDRNKHVHILVTIRRIGPDGFEKGKGGLLPEFSPDDVRRLRQKWAERGERELRRSGLDVEADRWKEGYLKNEIQALKALKRGDFKHHEKLKDRIPGIHLGPNVRNMEARGISTRKGEIHRAIKERNEKAKGGLSIGSAISAGGVAAKTVVKTLGMPIIAIADAMESLLSAPITPAMKMEGERARLLREMEAEERQHRERGRDR